MARRHDTAALLADVPLFSRCSKGELRTVARHVVLVEFRPGEQLMVAGDEGDALFVILEGEAAVVLADGDEHPLGPGDHVGELALLDRQPRTATVVARTDVAAAALGIRMFRTLLREFPSISEQMLAALAGELRAARAARG